MSRFADVTQTDVYTLPDGCQCPGTPHETDWIRIRVQAGAGDMVGIAEMDNAVGVIAQLATDWNLLDNDGEPAALTRENVYRLFGDGLDARFRAWLTPRLQASALGKGNGAGSSTGTSATIRQIRPVQPRRRSSK